MKKYIIGVVLLLISFSSYLDANVKMSKAHRSKTKDNVSVNCNYCHKSPGAQIPRKKGQDIQQLLKTQFCAGDGCHK